MSLCTFTSQVAGIPCQIAVRHFKKVPGNRSCVAEDPDEYYGWTECEFDVLDQRGRPAPWLERKLTADDRYRIEGEVEDHLPEECDA